jgi:hypothetical protein
MSEIHRYQVVKMLTEDGNGITYSPHGPEVVMAKDHEKRAAELEAELADLKVSYQTLRWESEDHFKRSVQYANEAEVRKAELAEAIEWLEHFRARRQ